MNLKRGIKIFFGNYKGGVGKTTSTYNIAVEMAKQYGKKVLLFDLDPQSSLSEVCMTSLNKQLDELSTASLNYVYNVYMQSKRLGNINVKVNSDNIILHTNQISFVPNTLFHEKGGLDKISMEIGGDIKSLLILRDFIEDNNLPDKYDFIFFDCPPSNNVITQSAFLYSDYYIIPTIMDPLSIKGVRHYVSVIEKIYENYCVDNSNAELLSLVFGEKPKLAGVFETMRKGNTDTINYRNAITLNGYYLFKSEIKDRKNVSETIGNGEETNNYEYFYLAKEILERINTLEG
ncbi:ParA family protein [Lysinibacillus sphaericus]|uniref:ParA family protein n=1 Tax=Lysinibacillus sphaericus TaxID=1421 RepID=UPI003D731DAE